jgi:TetR/AcrR family transcriptional regulator, regulator of cefoperazone and chloramphenicol sensitivity
VPIDRPQTTRDRLLEAAATLFAERGFQGTKVRDIAVRAGVNLAAGNYHYGSKKALYLEVLRAQFAAIQAELERHGARPEGDLTRLTRSALEQVLRNRFGVLLNLLMGPPPSLHATLMQRELCDPSEALPVIVDEFILPMLRDTEAIVAHLAPGLDAAQIQRCAFSVMGQALFYRFTMPATLRIWEMRQYPRGLADTLADHITEFSLGGLTRVASRPQRKHRRKPHVA